MGEAVGDGGGKADRAEQLDHPVQPLGRVADLSVRTERMGYGLQDGVAGIQRGERILEDQLHLAAGPAQLLPLEIEEVGAVEFDRSLVGAFESEEQPAHRRFARPALADQPQRLPGADGQADIVAGPDDRGGAQQGNVPQRSGKRVVLLEPRDGDQRLPGHDGLLPELNVAPPAGNGRPSHTCHLRDVVEAGHPVMRIHLP